MRPRDLIFLAIILAIAALMFFWPRGAGAPSTAAHVYVDGKRIDVIDMVTGQARDFTYDACPSVTIRRYDDGSVAVVTSDCPDQICVQSGPLRRVGDMTACVPNDVVVTIVASERGGEGDVDLIA
jgi:hypothetical protein